MKEMIKINGRVSKTGNNEQMAIDGMDDSTIGLHQKQNIKSSFCILSESPGIRRRVVIVSDLQ